MGIYIVVQNHQQIEYVNQTNEVLGTLSPNSFVIQNTVFNIKLWQPYLIDSIHEKRLKW